MATNLDYKNTNIYLGNTMRLAINVPNRVFKQDSKDYLYLYEGQEYAAQYNNKRARDIGSGYTNEINGANLMSGIAPRLQDILVSKIVSKPYVEGEDNEDNPIADKISNSYIAKKLHQAFNFSVSTGRAALVVDYDNTRELVGLRVFDGFRVKIKRDAFDRIMKVDLFLTKLNDTAFTTYFVVEERYWNKQGKPCQIFKLIKNETNDKSNGEVKKTIYDDVKRIPANILAYFNGVAFLKEIELDDRYQDELGIYLIDNSSQNKLFPYVDIPESQFLYVQDLLTSQDTTITYKEMDKEIGRGRVLIKSFQKPMFGIGGIDEHLGNAANVSRQIGMDYEYAMMSPRNSIFQEHPSMSMQEQAPTPLQFELRTEQWRNEISGNIGDICAAFGVSVLDYDPRLLQMGQRTDDEINAMTDTTRQTVEEKRELAKGEIDAMLTCMGRLYGLSTPLFIRWSLSSILNPTKNNALITAQLQNGTISLEEAIKRANPDYTAKELEEEKNRILKDRETALNNQAADGGFTF